MYYRNKEIIMHNTRAGRANTRGRGGREKNSQISAAKVS
jgi:hypothetical protein